MRFGRKISSKSSLNIRYNFRCLSLSNIHRSTLAATANVQSKQGNPEQPGLQYTRTDVPRHSDYFAYMEKIGGLAMAGENLVVDVEDLFLRLTAPSCGTQDDLASIIKVISSCFRKEIATSANIIVKKLTHSNAHTRSTSFNAVDISSLPKKPSLAFSETWEDRLKESGFSTSVTVYAACGDSCTPPRHAKATRCVVYKRSQLLGLASSPSGRLEAGACGVGRRLSGGIRVVQVCRVAVLCLLVTGRHDEKSTRVV